MNCFVIASWQSTLLQCFKRNCRVLPFVRQCFSRFRQNVSNCMRYAPLLTSLPLHRRAKRDLVIRRGQYLLCHLLYTALYTCRWSTCKRLSSMKVRTFLEARSWLGEGDWCGCGRPGRQSPRSGKMDILNERIYYLCSTNIIEPNKRKVNKVWFLGPFHMPVRPFVRMKYLGSHWRDFSETWHLRIF
jgi:hypothetical protein